MVALVLFCCLNTAFVVIARSVPGSVQPYGSAASQHLVLSPNLTKPIPVPVDQPTYFNIQPLADATGSGQPTTHADVEQQRPFWGFPSILPLPAGSPDNNGQIKLPEGFPPGFQLPPNWASQAIEYISDISDGDGQSSLPEGFPPGFQLPLDWASQANNYYAVTYDVGDETAPQNFAMPSDTDDNFEQSKLTQEFPPGLHLPTGLASNAGATIDNGALTTFAEGYPPGFQMPPTIANWALQASNDNAVNNEMGDEIAPPFRTEGNTEPNEAPDNF